MKVAVVIPARYASTRYPGKPLVNLLGKPMILWVAELCAKAVGSASVFIATDDERITEVVESAGYQAVWTGEAATGTDRIAQAAEKIDADIIINVQGDEPLVNPKDIINAIRAKQKYPDEVINGYCYLNEGEDPHSVNIPKVVCTEQGKLMYMSRLAVPGFKDDKNAPARYKKQVCIYAFNKSELSRYASVNKKSEVEHSEDIEILRFFEFDIPVRMVETSPGSLAVDCPEDVAGVEQALRELHGL